LSGSGFHQKLVEEIAVMGKHMIFYMKPCDLNFNLYNNNCTCL